jgi:hypothetical protein
MATTKGSTKDYTLATFAELLYPVGAFKDPDGAYGDMSEWRAGRARKAWARDYRAQCTWNDRTAKLLANTTPWDQRPVPVVDWTPAGMAKWARATMTDYPVHQSPEVRAFYKALAAIPDSYRDATPTEHRGACQECLYSAHVESTRTVTPSGHGGPDPFRLAPIPHTCGLAARKAA